MRPLAAYLRSLDPRLPRDVYILETGALVNAFGNGVVLPFLLIYLHNVRGIPFGLAGTAAAVQSAAALASGFLGGTLSDRLGPKRVLLGALAIMTVAFALMPLIHVAWQAFAIYTLWGIGSGAFWPSQAALLAGLAPAARRAQAYGLQRLAMNAGVALGGVAAGLIASVGHPETFTVLFVINCVTFLGYMIVLTRVRAPRLHDERLGGSWRAVLGHRVFTLFQLPVVKFTEGKSRMRGLALMGLLWAASFLVVWAAGTWTTGTIAFGILAGVMLVFAVGECLHGAIQAPLSVDLAPPPLVGRYLAASSISWQIGWIIGPAAGGFLLQHRPLLLWPIAAGANVACAAAALALERQLPERVRRTPRGETPVV